MSFLLKLKEVQERLQKDRIDGWLLYDFRGSNSLAYTFLEISKGKMLTRRFFYWIPQQGEPIKIVPMIEPYTLDHLPGQICTYRSWQELDQALLLVLKNSKQVAMEYSPHNALPIISKVDAGTIDLVRSYGVDVVSSANLLQAYTSVWTEKQMQTHFEAAELLDAIAAKTWQMIKQALESDIQINEYQVQQYMLDEMLNKGFTTDDAPVCAVNENSANPHYAPHADRAKPIQQGDFILIDLWCKKKVEQAVYADITRVGVADSQPSVRQQEIFVIVKQAQQQTTQLIRKRCEQKQPIAGWEADQLCRDVITQAGYAEFFIHRTGHNIGQQVHGPGANLDNFETHDFRYLLPGTCCSIEPGIYLPNEFGVRLEYDALIDFSGGLIVTGGVQDEIVCLFD